ncbi:MAG: MFS transporter [Chloroflexi bacterium]|nr:MFS transporter [Chloroflexota bacterium]
MKYKADELEAPITGVDIATDGLVRSKASLRNLKTFASLKNRAYRFYFLGMVGQWGSMNMQMVTRSLLIYRLTGSAAILGLMSLANALPMIVLSLFGGVIADRVQKKRVIQAGQLASAVVAFSVAILLTTGYLSPEHPGSWWVLIVNSVLQGTIMGLMQPSRQAIIPEIVSDENVMNAVALNSLGMNTLRFMAPALAGFLIDFVGFAAVFYAMTGLYISAVFFTSFLPVTGTTSVRGGNALVDIKQGLKYMRHETIIFLVLSFIVVSIILSMPYQMMMPIFADDILKVGATGLGMLMSASGVGAMIGSLAIASLPNKRRGAMLLISNLVLGLALTIFSFSRSWPLSLTLMVIVGLGLTGPQTLGTSLLQSYTEAEYLGRVMSINMMNWGLSSLGTFSAGIIAQSFGAQWALGGFSMALVLLCTLGLGFLPRLRKLD